jgi:hypothetical protein
MAAKLSVGNGLSPLVFTALISCALTSHAEPILSSNGYSGQGISPSANVIGTGTATVSFDSNIPGAKNTSGFNTQVGLGIYEGLELVGKLATNDQKCNMFVNGACPRDTIRDFSTSFKWQLPSQLLRENNSAVALGITDLGGAANYFRSIYAVGTKSIGPLDLSLGIAKASGEQAILGGTFGSVALNLNEWSSLKLEHLTQGNWMSASVHKQLGSTGLTAYMTMNHRMSGEPSSEKKWIGVGVSFPLDASGVSRSKLAVNGLSTHKSENKKVKDIEVSDLARELEEKGFWGPVISVADKSMYVEVENSAYTWNILDAVGVALGVISGVAHGNENRITNFELTVNTRGIALAIVTGELLCVRKWLESGEPCAQMKIESAVQRKENGVKARAGLQSLEKWRLRPELIISPTVISSVGTEYGSFNMDMGLNVNAVLPLWRGATIETNRVVPLGVGTSAFEQGGVFFGARLKPNTSRTLLHQVISVSDLNTQVRISTGTSYVNWKGTQIESSSQSDDGRHRIGIVVGDFNNQATGVNNEKNYALMTYRYAHGRSMDRMTELTQGKYWAGDTGWTLGQKFWYGDTALSLYMRRTRMSDNSPLVSFAGIQLSLPITSRANKGFENTILRGTSQWSYNLESRILAKENLLTGGFGEVPRVGESLTTTFNRDRNSTHYFDMNLLRVRDAYLNL